MKRSIAFLMALVLVSALLVVFAAADPAEQLPLWISHYDSDTDKNLEGAGIICLETNHADSWSYQLAFKPVEGKSTVFELVEYYKGDGGDHPKAAVPEGGFVYSLNAGNNWPKLIADNNVKGDGATGLWYDDAAHLALPNYNTDNVKATWEFMDTFEVGKIYTITGLDLSGKTLPTTTPDKDYWDPEYVCTATIAEGDHEESAEPVQETITVDGKLDDNGWDKGYEVFAPGSNATWQGKHSLQEGVNVSGKYQLRKDDSNLYVAAILDEALQEVPAEKTEANGYATNFRIWVHDGTEDATTYTQFYDVYVKDGKTVVRGYENTNKTGNTKQEFTTAAAGVMVADGEKTNIEACIPLSEIKGGDNFSIYFAVSGLYGVDGANCCLFIPAFAVDDPENSPNANAPYSNFDKANAIIAETVSELGTVGGGNDQPTPPVDDKYAEEIAAKVGEPAADGKFDITFGVETSDDRNSTVTITLNNFKAEDKISSILFPIFFDDERLEPNFNINDDNSVNCFGNLPGEKWENMTVYNPADDTSDVNNFPGQAHVYVQILNAEKEDQVCKADTEITITLNFKLKEGFDKGGVWIPTENVEATSWDDPAGQNIFRATGGSAIAELPEDQPSDPTPPVDDPTQPGDAGILVFAILGVLAVIGAAVVVKVRK